MGLGYNPPWKKLILNLNFGRNNLLICNSFITIPTGR